MYIAERPRGFWAHFALLSEQTECWKGEFKMTYQVIFQPSGIRYQVPSQTTVLQAARQVGVVIPASCGGGHTCGKCKVQIVRGKHCPPANAAEKQYLTVEELDQGYRLACMLEVQEDLTVKLPTGSVRSKPVIAVDGRGQRNCLKPAVKSYYLELNRATLDDHRDDFTRIQDALQQYEGVAEELQIDYEVLKELSAVIRAGGWKITVYLHQGSKVIGICPGRHEGIYGVAADVGTTTVAVYLCDLRSGRLLQTSSFINPQVPYGEDVLSRLSYCMQHENGVQTLQQLLMQELGRAITEMVKEQGITAAEIGEVVMVANTVMEFIALGIVPRALGSSPFVAPFTGAIDIPARELGLKLMTGANVHCLPGEAGFIGSDNVAVLLAEEPYKQKNIKLIIDIGTNSEICLGSERGLYSTSCATGPALEGAQIQCGMRAAGGAIEAVIIDRESWEPEIRIIGFEEGAKVPSGICGSGILDAVAQMAEAGIIEPSGRFTKEKKSSRIRRNENGKKEYVLYFKQSSEERDIVVTAKDVRAVQLAKAALYAGVICLMKYCGITEADEVILAGAFGSHVDQKNALKLGLFPSFGHERITVCGNAAGVGARLALLNTDKRSEAVRIAQQTECIETAADEVFYKIFSQAMRIGEGNTDVRKNID